MLMCLIFFVLGFLVARMMRGNGMSVGGENPPCSKDTFNPAIPCNQVFPCKTKYDCDQSVDNKFCLYRTTQSCLEEQDIIKMGIPYNMYS